MKVVILAGGLGTRLSEYTDTIPKPMVHVGGKPILWHIMKRYSDYGFKDFFIALGYKSDFIKKYFLSFNAVNSDFEIDLSNSSLKILNKNDYDWKVTLVDTGLDSMTGGRVKRISKFLNNEPFMLTYGDGLADIDIQELLSFHKSNKKMVTVTAVRPVARFGELEINGSQVNSFQEKPQVTAGWINGGFFVCEPEFVNLIKNDLTVLEKEPLETASTNKELVAYKHHGFWQCMDTKRDKDYLDMLMMRNKAPWLIK